MPVPYTFGTATSSIPLSQLDSNFATAITIGNTAVQLGNTVTTLNNMTLANVTISSGNVTITNVSVTTANATTANIGTLVVTANATVAGNVSVTGNVSMNVATITTANVTTTNTSSLIVTGNETFVGTGNRILGDFTNATITSRTAFQTSTANSTTGIYALPSGTSTAASWQAANNSDPTNASKILIATNGSTDVQLVSGINGTGTYLPMTFYNSGSEKMRLDTSGNLGVGTNSPSTYSILTAYGSSAAGFAGITAINGAGSTGLGGIQFGSDGTYVKSAIALKREQANGGGSLVFYNSSSSGAANWSTSDEKMRIDFAGNVGIGTSSPVGKLDVYAASGVAVYVRDATVQSLIGTDTSTAYYGTNGAYPVRFLTSNTERMRIDSSGNLLVGTTSANGRLAVNSAGTTSATYAVYMQNSAPTDLFYIRSDGVFNTGAAASSPYNATTATAANVVVASNGQLQRSTSSLKYKTDVQDATHGLANVLQLRSVTYKGKNDGDKVFGGLIAEEVHEAGLTEFVQYAEDGSPDALAYGNMVSLCIKSIQELKAINDAQASTIQSLTDRISTLEKKIMITWTIEQMQCLPVAEGKTNVVTTVHWRVSAVDGDFSAGAYGSCSIPFSSGTFTPFADLTEAQVCDWIWANGVDKDEIEANLNQQIATQKNPPVVTPPLPWNQA